MRTEERAPVVSRCPASSLHPSMGVRESAGLAPNDDPVLVARIVAEAREPWRPVGHLPHLSRLLSLLVLGDPDRALVAFRMGGLIGLCSERGDWRLRFILTPELVLQKG